MNKIDIHCHVTNRILKNCAMQDASVYSLNNQMKLHDVERSIVLATYFPHKGTGISNYRIINMTKDHDNIDIFGSLDFEHYFYQGFNELEELADQKKIKGIKLYTCYQNIDLNSKKIDEVANLAISYNLPLMFHVGHSHNAKRSTGKIAYANLVKPKDIGNLVERHPKLTTIIAHMGKPFLDDLIETINHSPNIYTDMSGLIDSKNDWQEIPECIESIKRFVNECGPKKLLFGTDFPVQTHKDSIFFIEKAMEKFSDNEKQDVYYNNAQELLE